MNKLERTNVMEKSLNVILFVFLISVIHPVDAATEDDDITSHLICPCECAMIISTCDCTTAIQVKKEIYGMKENGFSEKQIISALKAEYGNDILVMPQKDDTMLLWVGVSLAAILVFLVYILSRKPKPDIILMHGREKYERLFEEEYRKFVSELGENEEPDNKYSSKKGIV